MKRILGVLIAVGVGSAVLGVARADHDAFHSPPCKEWSWGLEWKEQVVRTSTGVLKRPEDVVHYTVQVELDLKELNIKLPECSTSTGGEDPQWLTDALSSIDAQSNLTEEQKESARQQLRAGTESNCDIEFEYAWDFDAIEVECSILADRIFIGNNSRVYHPRFVNGVVTQVSVPICIADRYDPRSANKWACILQFNGNTPDGASADPELKAATGTELVTHTGGQLIFGMGATVGFVAGDQQRTFEDIELPEEYPFPLPVNP